MSEAAIVRIQTEEERVAVVDRARAMLERARTPIEAKQVHDLAEAAKTYARLQKLGEEAVRHAQAIAVDALALMGEMLKQSPKNTGAQGIGPIAVPVGNRNQDPLTLAEQGISKKQSMVAQSLATAKESKPQLYEQVKVGAVSVSAAHAEVRRLKEPEPEPEPEEPSESDPPSEPTIAAVPGSRPSRPAHFKGGSNSDPDHPFARTLKAMTALVKAMNADIAADETGFLKANLSALSAVAVKQRQVVHGDDIWKDGERQKQPAKFAGLALLRSLVRNSGRLKKTMTVVQIKKLCEQINTAPASQVIISEGDE